MVFFFCLVSCRTFYIISYFLSCLPSLILFLALQVSHRLAKVLPNLFVKSSNRRMSCLTSKGYLGKCTSLHECHPFYNIKDDLPDWVFGSGEACYQSGVCCKKTSIKGGMQQRIIVPASTVLLDFGRNAISFSKPFEQDKYNQGK